MLMSSFRLVFGLTLALLAALAPAARASEPVAMHVGGDVRTMTREVCARKAVEAMGVHEKFPFAEVTADGNARGWNDKTAVLVLALPTPAEDTIMILIVAAGKDNEQAARLRNVIRAHIFDGPLPANGPKRIAPKGVALPPCPVFLCWSTEERSAITLLRFFEAVATLVLEKQGFGTNSGGKDMIFGGFPGRAVVAFLSPLSTGVLARLNVIAATDDEETSRKLAKELLARIVKVIYE
jgi:hypothetical protein